MKVIGFGRDTTSAQSDGFPEPEILDARPGAYYLWTRMSDDQLTAQWRLADVAHQFGLRAVGGDMAVLIRTIEKIAPKKKKSAPADLIQQVINSVEAGEADATLREALGTILRGRKVISTPVLRAWGREWLPGVYVVYGPPGSGKTRILRKLYEQLKTDNCAWIQTGEPDPRTPDNDYPVRTSELDRLVAKAPPVVILDSLKDVADGIAPFSKPPLGRGGDPLGYLKWLPFMAEAAAAAKTVVFCTFYGRTDDAGVLNLLLGSATGIIRLEDQDDFVTVDFSAKPRDRVWTNLGRIHHDNM